MPKLSSNFKTNLWRVKDYCCISFKIKFENANTTLSLNDAIDNYKLTLVFFFFLKKRKFLINIYGIPTNKRV